MMIANFIKSKRKTANLTQKELAEKSGVGLRFLRELEKGKETMRIDKINQVLLLFGYVLGPVQIIDNSILYEKGDNKIQ